MDSPNPKDFFSEEYQELRRVAARVLRRDPRSTMNPTALVNEAYLKVVASGNVKAVSPLHLKRIIARAMRQVLVEGARRRGASKRGAGFALVTLNEEIVGVSGADGLLAVHAALEELALMNEGHAQVLEYRIFGGYEFSEIAEMMEVSRTTVMRYWKLVRAWLQLRQAT